MSEARRPEGQSTEKSATTSRSLPWFRLHTEFATDPVVTFLSFEDQRHFVVILCLKCAGVLDRAYRSAAVRDAVVAHGLGLSLEIASGVRERLLDVDLIRGDWQPSKWDARQYISDNSTERVRRHRQSKKRERNVTETDQRQIQKQKQKQKKIELLPVATTRGEPR